MMCMIHPMRHVRCMATVLRAYVSAYFYLLLLLLATCLYLYLPLITDSLLTLGGRTSLTTYTYLRALSTYSRKARIVVIVM
jgi:hypothetical protein